MVDDLTAAAINRMKAEGYTPALVVETSPGNFQAWLNHGQVLPQRLSTLAARALAEKFGGDRGAADWRHFGRLAGFTNLKEKYQTPNGYYPFVRVEDGYPAHLYPAAGRLLSRIREESYCSASPLLKGTALRRDQQKELTIDAFRSNPKYNGDGNRVDMAYALYAVIHGVSEAAIAEAISSRDLSKKGPLNRQEEYVSRTIAKAMGHVGLACGR
jgi:hypothetical protein